MHETSITWERVTLCTNEIITSQRAYFARTNQINQRIRIKIKYIVNKDFIVIDFALHTIPLKSDVKCRKCFEFMELVRL
jgi:hypothetical protein